MNQERVEEDFKHYKIIAAKRGDLFRAVGWPSKDGLQKIDVAASTMEAAITQAKNLALSNERTWASNAYAKLIGDESINPKIASRVRLAMQSPQRSLRESSCHRCGASVFGTSAIACLDCKWMICPECGHCGCDYSGPINRIN